MIATLKTSCDTPIREQPFGMREKQCWDIQLGEGGQELKMGPRRSSKERTSSSRNTKYKISPVKVLRNP